MSFDNSSASGRSGWAVFVWKLGRGEDAVFRRVLPSFASFSFPGVGDDEKRKKDDTDHSLDEVLRSRVGRLGFHPVGPAFRQF